MTIYELKNSMSVIGNQLKKVEQDISNKAANPAVSMEDINALAKEKEELKARFELIKAQHDEMVSEEEAKVKAQMVALDGGEFAADKTQVVNAKAEFFKNVMTNKGISTEINNSLGGFGTGANGGDKFLPKTMTNDLLTEPTIKNPLRNLSTFSNIAGLEIPKINFTIDEVDFTDTDSETAKEIEATGELVQFGRNKIKVFVPITDTLLHGTNTNLVQTVEAALQSGLAAKEKQIAFLPATNTTAKVGTSESFYKCDPAIKEITGATMFEAITNALADLDDEFGDNAKVTMRKVDYYAMIKELANGSTSLYMAQPEQVIGAPVEFCDKAIHPIVGDFRYSHYNYDPQVIYDRDKNVRTGVYDFVLTAWVDHKIKLKNAFRKVKVVVTP